MDGGNTGVASAVAVDGNFAVGRLTIDAGDSVTINDGRSLSLVAGAFAGAGTLLNNGTLRLNSAGNLTDLRFDGSSVAFNGTGTIIMSGNGNNRIFGSGGTLTIGANQTIQGGGSLGLNLGTFINNGMIVANNAAGALTVDPDSTGGFTNNGVMRANGGTLVLTGSGGGAFINTNGTIEALASSEVQLVSGAFGNRRHPDHHWQRHNPRHQRRSRQSDEQRQLCHQRYQQHRHFRHNHQQRQYCAEQRRQSHRPALR